MSTAAQTGKPGTNGQPIDRRTVAKWLRVFIEPKQVAELRCPDAGRYRTVSGYFDNPDLMAEAALEWSGKVPAVYFTINPCQPDLLARRVNRAEAYAKETTSDSGILRRRWFFIDFDPRRPSGISSTDAEHAAALERARHCRDWLGADGWPSPVDGDSSNGAHLLYAIDLPNDGPSLRLLEQCLKALAFRFSDAQVEVDLKTCNAGRICKLYGTLSCKGDSTPDRPHRVARVLTVPDPLVKVPRDLLEGLAATATDDPPEMERKGLHFVMRASGFDLARWIEEHNLPVVCSGDWKDGKKWVLNPCPWNEEHTNRAAFIVQMGNGKIGAGCHHNGCAGKGWHDLRDVYEPGWRERRAAWEQAQQQSTGQAPKEGTVRERMAVVRSFDRVPVESTQWLWSLRVPRGALTLLDGDPGLGKSTLAIDLAARVSRGWLMPPAGGPCEAAEPEGVLLLSAEDDVSRTIRPRLDAADASVSHVFTLDAIRRGGDEQSPPVLPFDLDIVEEVLRANDVALMVVDPLLAYLDGELDAHRDQDVRRCMHKLKLLAESTGVAVLLIRHLNKMGHNVALYRGGGSIGIVGACRSGLVVGTDPDDPSVRVLASVKSNLGPKPRSLTYTLDPVGDVARIAWGEETDLTANDILSHPEPKGAMSKPQQCAELLRGLLARGPVDADELDRRCKAAGFREYAVRSARKLLQVRSFKHSMHGGWMVEMPLLAEGVEDGEPRP